MVVTVEKSLAAWRHSGESWPILADERLRSNGSARLAHALRKHLKRKGATVIDNPIDIITQKEGRDAVQGRLCGHPFWQASSSVSMYLVRANASQL